MPRPLRYWLCKNTSREIALTSDDIVAMAHEIAISHGGFLKKGSSIIANEKNLTALVDHVVISGQLCAILSSLGRGAFGQVFKAFDYQIARYVAVKAQPSMYADVISRQSTTTRRHGIGLADPRSNAGPTFLRNGYGYIIIPLADTDYVNWSAKKCSEGNYKKIIESLIDIAKDLQKLHAKKLVHMDLKMDNILVVNDKAYLADFGKVEIENKFIPSAQGCYVRYPQCDPNYFLEYSKNPSYLVSHKYDLYSFGKIIKDVSTRVKDRKLKQELINISKNIHQLTPESRTPISQVIGYLETLYKNMEN